MLKRIVWQVALATVVLARRRWRRRRALKSASCLGGRSPMASMARRSRRPAASSMESTPKDSFEWGLRRRIAHR